MNEVEATPRFQVVKDNFIVFGVTVGACVAVLVTLVVCVWEWIENPNGIFRNADGTNWQFMFDTAVSWIVPTFEGTALLAGLLHLTWFGVAALLKKL